MAAITSYVTNSTIDSLKIETFPLVSKCITANRIGNLSILN